MAYANFCYCDYTAQRNNLLTQFYKNLNQYKQLFTSGNYGHFTPITQPTRLFNLYNTDSLSFSGFKYPTLPERKLSIPKTTKAPNMDFAKFEKNALAYKEEGFLDGVKAVAQNINCDYKDLLAVMNAECGFKHHKANNYSGAVGLIQFTKRTAKRLGTSTTELSKMSAADQLVYVEKFLKKCKKTYGFSEDTKLSGADLYSLIFLPARAKRKNVLCEEGETNKNGKLLRYYEGNKGMDLNKDGKITKAEIAARVEKFRVRDIGLA